MTGYRSENPTELPNYRAACFLTSAAKLSQCPSDEGSEVAFAGRSNSGKSSAINSLTGNKKLARTSKTPGRTQLLNFFSLSEERRLVDLPGYGYAKVPDRIKKSWARLVENYLWHRRSLRGLILLIDSRHPLQPFDHQMLSWANAVGMPTHILLTKSDKLKRGASKKALLSAKDEIKVYGELISVQLFSSEKNDGHLQVLNTINCWLTACNSH